MGTPPEGFEFEELTIYVKVAECPLCGREGLLATVLLDDELVAMLHIPTSLLLTLYSML